MKLLPLGLPPGGTVDATKLFLKPGRLTRPDRICVILRGLPGTSCRVIGEWMDGWMWYIYGWMGLTRV
jgi:hypothetical protein